MCAVRGHWANMLGILPHQLRMQLLGNDTGMPYAMDIEWNYIVNRLPLLQSYRSKGPTRETETVYCDI